MMQCYSGNCPLNRIDFIWHDLLPQWIIQAKIKLIKNITVTSIHLTYFYTAFICRVSLDNINTACLPDTYKLTSSSTFFVFLFTGFEQHFSVRVNDTFKRDFLRLWEYLWPTYLPATLPIRWENHFEQRRPDQVEERSRWRMKTED